MPGRTYDITTQVALENQVSYVRVLRTRRNPRKEWCSAASPFSCASPDRLPPLERHRLGARRVPLAETAVVLGDSAAAEGCRLLSQTQTAVSAAPLLALGKEKPCMVFCSDFFSVARCLTFSYFFPDSICLSLLAVLHVFSTFTMPDRIKYHLFSLVAI